MKLGLIYEELILEFVNNNLDTIISAINDKRLINIYYDDDRTELTGWRRVEPFCVGINKYGNVCLRAWQEHGVSASYPPGKKNDPLTHIPGWRMFRLDKITNINTTGNDRFTAARPKYNPKDKDMTKIYAAADFGGNGFASYDTNPVSPTPTPITPTSNIPQTSPVVSTPTATPPSGNFASYHDEPQQKQDDKAGLFDKWAKKFKNLIGYNSK